MAELWAFPTPYDGVYDALRRLGSTSEEIADSLAERGIRGRRMEERACPLANYLRNELTVAVQIEAGSVQIDGVDGFMSTAVCDGVEDFIEDFDDEGYPFLIEQHPKEPPA